MCSNRDEPAADVFVRNWRESLRPLRGTWLLKVAKGARAAPVPFVASAPGAPTLGPMALRGL